MTRIIYGRAKANNVSVGTNKLIILSNDLTRKEFIILFLLLIISLIFGLFPHLIIEGVALPISTYMI